MAEIVTLRDRSDRELNEMLENALEEMFNLRFQKASARLKDTARLEKVRREVAQLKTVLHNRQQAIAAAVAEPAVAGALAGREWRAEAHFDYEASVWRVTFSDNDGAELAWAHVNLNQKKRRSRRRRRAQAPTSLVTAYEAGE